MMISPDDIRKIRRQLELTQEELASSLHVSQQLVAYWERGGGHPPDHHFVVLLQIKRLIKKPAMKRRIKQAMIFSRNDMRLTIQGLRRLMKVLFGDSSR